MDTNIDRRLVLQYDIGQMTFRHLHEQASFADVFRLARAINDFQVDDVKRVLLVTVESF